MTNPTKQDLFNKVATDRTRKILKDVAQLGSMATNPRYEFSPDQISTVFDAINDALNVARQRFTKLDQSQLFSLIPKTYSSSGPIHVVYKNVSFGEYDADSLTKPAAPFQPEINV